MRRYLSPLLFVAMAMFAVAPVLIERAPYEASMGLVQKIFYFHVPSAMVMFVSAFVCGIASVLFLFKNRPSSDHVAAAAGELTAVFGLIVLVTGPMWARRAWGVWWEWDARLTSSLLVELIFVAYLLVRKYGGPASEKLAAAIALFGMANVPFVYVSVNLWRTLHPRTTVAMTLPAGMKEPFWFSVAAFGLLYIALLTIRSWLGRERAELERAYLELEEE